MQTVPPILQRYLDGLEAHDVDRIAGTVADDLAFVTKNRILTKAQFLGVLRAIYAGFPDWQYEYGAPEFRGEIIAVKFRQGGLHTGTFALPGSAALAATGRRVSIPEHYFFYRLRGEQIVEIRPEPVPGGAPFGILDQLGLPTPS